MAKTRAQQNREIRQESLRDFLSNQKLIEKVIDNIGEIDKLEASSEHFTNTLNKLKTSNDQRMKLINKYLPDLKQADISQELNINSFEQILDELE